MLFRRIKKVVRIETLSRLRNIRNSEIQRQYNNQPKHVNRQRGIRPGNDDLEKGKHAVHEMLGDAAPSVMDHREPWRSIQYYPVDVGHEERVGHYCGVEGRMEGLERPGCLVVVVVEEEVVVVVKLGVVVVVGLGREELGVVILGEGLVSRLGVRVGLEVGEVEDS